MQLTNYSSSCRAEKDGGKYESTPGSPSAPSELGVLFFYLSLLKKPAMENIRPINPIPVVIYAKLPAQEISMQIASKRIAIPKPIFFIELFPLSNQEFV